MKRVFERFFLCLLCLAVLFSGARLIQAQEFRSTLTGQVIDPSGAVIAGATVLAVENDTQIAYSGTTSDTGVYYIPYMLPGTYTVTVKSDNFKTQVQENVHLVASQSYGLNFQLEIGATAEQITVTAAPPAIETVTGSGGTVLSGREIENVPLNGRQIYMLLGTTPGSQFLQTQFGAGGFSGTRGWDVTNNYSIGGAVQGYQLFTLNGSNITALTGYGPEGSWFTAPNVDAIQEVNVMTQTYDSRYGHTGGGTVNIVTKSGTNDYHGDLYDYFENGALNANNFENNLNGVPRQDIHQQQYGGTLGGPIKKDKLFFFGSFEGYWENIPFTTLTSVPTLAMRSGDFSQSGYQIYDPATTVCTAAGGEIGNCPGNAYSRSEFQNDTIPSGDISPIGAALVGLYPTPNINTASPINNFIANVPDKYRYYQPMGRVDYAESEKTHWYSTYEYQWGTEFRDSSGFTGPAENGNINSRRDNTAASVDMTHTFSPTFVGDFKLSFARFIDSFPDGPLSTPTPGSIGLNMPTVGTEFKQLLPEIYFSEQYPQIIGNSVGNDVEQNMVFNADFTKTRGAHSFEFGGEIGDYYFANPDSVGHPNGDFTFGTDDTQLNPTNRGAISAQNGNVVADLLLGYPDSGGVDWNQTVAEGFPLYTLYGQDNWRVTRKLTVNIGLRYDVERGLRERHDRLDRGMCVTCINPVTNNETYQANIANASNIAAWDAARAGLGSGAPAISPGTVYGGIEFPGVNGQSIDAYNTDWGNLAPRFGFAYALNDKTVIRGGWGWVYAYGIEAGTTDGFSITTPYIASLNSGVTPSDYFATGAPFPSGAQQPVGASQGLLTGVGDVQAIDWPQRKIPRSQIMSLGIQRELPGHMTLDVGYDGNYARALRTQGAFQWVNGTLPLSFGYDDDLQQKNYSPAFAGLLNTQVPNPYYGALPSNTQLGGLPTLPLPYLMVPLDEFALVGDYTNPYGKSWYDALQVKLNKRLYGTTRGLSFQLGYTYSKNMELTDYRNGWPWQDAHPIYEPIGYDRTNVFTLTGQWDAPFGRGSKYFLTDASGVLGQVVNNWRLSWVFTDESGFPQGLNTGLWYTGSHSYVPTGGPTFEQWIYNCGSAGPLSCWNPIPSWGQGNLPDQVTYLRQPTIPSLDLALQKDFPITESKKLQFRAEAFNFMNTPLFPGPDTNPYDGSPVRNANGSWSGFGTIPFNQQNFPRIMQLSLKFFF
jgi:Carboxypeptidase regulatory-like domain